MSKSSKVKKTKSHIGTQNTKADNRIFEEKVNWEDLILARNEAVDTLMKQQVLFLGLVENYKEKIDSDPKAFAIVDGVLKSFKDIAVDIISLSVQHAEETKEVNGNTQVTKFRSGPVDVSDDDSNEELDYLRIATGYVSITEKLAFIASSAYLDVFTSLKIPTDDLNKVITSSVDELNKTVKDNKDGR